MQTQRIHTLMKHLLIVIGLVMPLLMHAQSLQLQLGEQHKLNSRGDIVSIFHSDHEGLYIHQEENGVDDKWIFRKYSHDLKFLWEMEYEPTEHKGDKLEPVLVFPLKNGFGLLASNWDLETKANYAFINHYDKDGNIIKENTTAGAIAETKLLNRGGFTHSISSDTSKIIIFAHNKDEAQKADHVGFIVLDEDLNIQWKHQDAALPYSDNGFQFIDCYVDDEGSVYITGKMEEGEKKKSDDYPYYRHVILKYSPNESDPVEVTVEVPERQVQKLTLKVVNDHIYVAGLYGERKKLSISGSFFQKIQKGTLKVEHRSKEEFGTEFLTKHLKNQEVDGAISEFLFRVDDLVVNPDGSAALVAEQYEKVVTSSFSNGMYQSTTNYHYNHILVTRISSEGDIWWVKEVPKRQTTFVAFDNASYHFSMVGDKMIFIFNDNPESLRLTIDDKPESVKWRNAVSVVATFDENGNYSKKILFNEAKYDELVTPRLVSPITNGAIIFPHKKGKKLQLGKVKFVEKMAQH